MTEALDEVQKVIRPTVLAMNSEYTRNQILDRIYNELNVRFDKFNKCMKKVQNENDRQNCQERVIQYLQNDGLNFAKKVALDY